MEHARLLLAENYGSGVLRYHRGEFHRHGDGRFRPVPDADVRAAAVHHLDRHFTNLKKIVVADVLECVRAAALLDSGRVAPCWVGDPARDAPLLAFTNGLVDRRDALAGRAAVRPHSPDWFSPVRLPFPYDPDATCPTWERVLAANLEGDAERIDLMREWFGYALAPDNGQQKFMILNGDGGTGKSVALAAMQGVVGAESCSSVPLERFGDRFALWGTRGKLLNVVAEIGETDKIAEGRLKEYTAGDVMEFERKQKDSIYEVPTARCVFSTNTPPRFSDRTDGVWRRLLLVPFDRKVPDAEKVPGMHARQWWEDSGELPGLFNWAMAGRRRLDERGAFTEPAACRDALARYRESCNPTGQFLADHYRHHPGATVPKAEVYGRYRQWAAENGYRPMADGPLGKEVCRAFPGVTDGRRRIGGERVRLYFDLAEGDGDDD